MTHQSGEIFSALSLKACRRLQERASISDKFADRPRINVAALPNSPPTRSL